MKTSMPCNACNSMSRQHICEQGGLANSGAGFFGQVAPLVFVPVSVYRSYCACGGQGEHMEKDPSNQSESMNEEARSVLTCNQNDSQRNMSTRNNSGCNQCRIYCSHQQAAVFHFCPTIHHFHSTQQGLMLCSNVNGACRSHNECMGCERVCYHSCNSTSQVSQDRTSHDVENDQKCHCNQHIHDRTASENKQHNPHNQGRENVKTSRRLSSDSGRVTWSDSGESAFSDIQAGDSNTRATCSTGQGTKDFGGMRRCRNQSTSHPTFHALIRANMRSCPDPNESTAPDPAVYPIHLKENLCNETTPVSMPSTRSRTMMKDGSGRRTPGRRMVSQVEQRCQSNQVEAEKVFQFQHAKEGAGVRNQFPPQIATKYTKNQVKSPGNISTTSISSQELARRELPPVNSKRSHSDFVLSHPAGEDANALSSARLNYRYSENTEIVRNLSHTTPQFSKSGVSPQLQRPRSRSLFLIPDIAEWNTDAIQSTLFTKNRAKETPDFKDQTVDFTSWVKAAVLVREISGDGNSKEVKSYGITALPSQRAFAITDADKVKIKIYSTLGEMTHSFGTPTWPRYGRGITCTRDQKHIAVCHLTEVCVYTLDGKPVKRFPHEEFTACWGIACDTKGNYVVTDPKSSSVFILNSEGHITKHIKGKSNIASRMKSSSCKNVRKSHSWKANLSIKALRTSYKRERMAQERVRVKSDSIRRLSNISLPPIEGSNLDLYGESSSTKSHQKVRLIAPRYVAVNSKNQILVTDTKQRCLLVFEANGKLIFSIGGGRMGCKNCTKEKAGNHRYERRPMSANDLVDIMERSSLIEECEELDSPTRKSNSTKSHNLLYGICSSESICSAKEERVKVLGAMNRGNLGRNESVESEVYTRTTKNMEQKKVLESPTKSNSVGNRLHEHGTPELSNGSSHPDLSTPTKGNSNIRNKEESNYIRKFARGLSKRINRQSLTPLWIRRRNKKSGNSAIAIQEMTTFKQFNAGLGRCHSLKSLNSDSGSDVSGKCEITPTSDNDLPFLKNVACSLPVPLGCSDAFSSASSSNDSYLITFSPIVTGNDSDQSVVKSSPIKIRNTKKQVFSSPIESTEDDNATTYSFNLNEYSIISSESAHECDWDDLAEDESDESAACRRCHVEDPRGVCVDENDNILLVDRARQRVTIFTPDGHFIRHILTEEDGLKEPMTATILHDGTLAVTDLSSTIKIFQF